MDVRYASKFKRQFNKTEPKIQEAFIARRVLFQKNPLHPLLQNHILRGKYKGMRSINVTGDWRAIYSETRHGHSMRTIIFELLGTHSQLYK